jgi:Tfp pilus assembly protein PilF
VLGEDGGTVHDWPADREYMPEFVDTHRLIHMRPARASQGRSQPIQLVGISGARGESSAEYFRVALDERPDDPSILSNYGNWLRERGELDQAEAAYRKAIAIDDRFANAHGNLALLLDDLGDLDSAEREHRRALELDDESAIHAANLAFFLWRQRHHKETGEQLLRDAAERQRNAFTVSRLALFTDIALDDDEQARELYAELLRMEPDDPWTHGRLAEHLQRKDQTHAARQHFERATAGEHPDLDALVSYAAVQVRDRDFEPAAELLRRALKLRPRNPAALAMLAAVRTLLGAPAADLERMYRQVLEWQPGHVLASLNLAQLLLRQDPGDDEGRRLLQDTGNKDLDPELRLELLFYGVAYAIRGFEEGPAEITSLLKRGVRLPIWDVSSEAGAARDRGHPYAELLEQVAGGERL